MGNQKRFRWVDKLSNGSLRLVFLSAFSVSALFTVSAMALQKPRLHLTIASHNLPPYHWTTEDNHFVGPAKDKLVCILNQLPITYEIKVLPWARAQALVKNEMFDAFFIGSQNAKRDVFATFTVPFYFDSWHFYYHPTKPLNSSDRDFKVREVGVLVGSNMQTWLGNNGFNNTVAHTEYSTLFRSLNHARVDMVMATQGIFESIRHQNNWPENQFLTEKVRDLKLGLYIGKHFEEENPDFLSQFNQSVKKCL